MIGLNFVLCGNKAIKDKINETLTLILSTVGTI